MGSVDVVESRVGDNGKLLSAALLTRTHAKGVAKWCRRGAALRGRCWAEVERARAEQALRASEELARTLLGEAVAARAQTEEANRAKDEFLATMSHELRAPLNAIPGWATMVWRDRGNEAKREHGLAVIERNARAQAKIVNDLLDVSRIVTGKLRLSVEKVQLSQIVHAAVHVVEPPVPR